MRRIVSRRPRLSSPSPLEARLVERARHRRSRRSPWCAPPPGRRWSRRRRPAGAPARAAARRRRLDAVARSARGRPRGARPGPPCRATGSLARPGCPARPAAAAALPDWRRAARRRAGSREWRRRPARVSEPAASHQVTSVPTPWSVNSSATMLCGVRPSTMCTARRRWPAPAAPPAPSRACRP